MRGKPDQDRDENHIMQELYVNYFTLAKQAHSGTTWSRWDWNPSEGLILSVAKELKKKQPKRK